MARAITYAIRVTSADGREVFLREGGIGVGPIRTFRMKETAERTAETIRRSGKYPSVTVIERSHGRQFPAAREAESGASVSAVSDGDDQI